MPLYEYKCDDCENTFEERQSYSDDPIETCPTCGGKLHKIIFPVPAHYKAAGFFITEQRGLTGKKRKPNIKVGLSSELPEGERNGRNK